MTANSSNVQALKTVVKPVAAVNEQLDSHEKVNLRVNPGAKKMWLKVADFQHGTLNLPLGEVESHKKGEHPEGYNVLVPVVPVRYTTPDCQPEEATIMRPGWLYVFKDDKIWRELEVNASGYMADISLEHTEGQETRKATGVPDNRLLLPYKIGGQRQDIKIAFS
ncbi:MAG: hypothetical protein ABFR97_08685, partial [Thermodesulfobacteriota bacterium]